MNTEDKKQLTDLDFRIDWGYQMLYSRRHYHPVYRWDGRLRCDRAVRLRASLLEYPVSWWGPCHTAREIPLPTAEWRSSTRRGLAGVRIKAECEEDAIFHLQTMAGVFSFSARRVMHEKHFCFSLGPKYGFCSLIVCLTDHYWFCPPPRNGQVVFSAADLPLPQEHAQRTRLAVLEPDQSVELDVELGKSDIVVNPERDAVTECLVHLQAMPLLPGLPDGRNHVAVEIPLRLAVDGEPAAEQCHYFRFHDQHVQLLEDVWLRFPGSAGRHRISLKNCHSGQRLCISRISFELKITRHLQLSLPRWMLYGRSAAGRIYAVHRDRVALSWPGGTVELTLTPGWNEFEFQAEKPSLRMPVTASSVNGDCRETAVVEAVYALTDEKPEVMVGYDMTVVPHDDSGFMDWLLDYTDRTQLGNTVVFRNFRPDQTDSKPSAPDYLLARWGDFCARHRIYVQSVNCHQSGVLASHAGKYMHNSGAHEYPGVVYALDPRPETQSVDMKEACERYIEYLKAGLSPVSDLGERAAYGDASGGARYSYLAGASFLRSETMVPHTQHICSLARPAAEALGRGDWGVHIAIQHPVQPYHPEHHLGQFFLSLMQPWMMGASMIYEEDSLFLMFKEERQGWDDALTKGKRDLLRRFFRFVKTHPRSGRIRRLIASLEGRYAAPFNGFICGPEQSPHYSVWGKFGNSDFTWGHRQPEKFRHLLDVLMPGASVHPLRQCYDKRRFFFSGTPHGDFDQVPVEADSSYLQQYSLLFNLGWHTMIEEDYVKLREYVLQGGTLFTGITQFSTHVKRDFLSDMSDLSLWNGGDLSELCGVEVLEKGEEYSGQWMGPDKESMLTPEDSRFPNDFQAEDGPCHLASLKLRGAETIAWDAGTGAPLLVRHRLDRGWVYLLCAWAYPGHESLSSVASAWLRHLADQHRDDWYVEDPSREVFWTCRRYDQDGYGRIMLLNTDWTNPGNVKPVVIRTPAAAFSVEVIERRPCVLTVLPSAVLSAPENIHIEIVELKKDIAKLLLHGTGDGVITVYSGNDSIQERRVEFIDSPILEWELLQPD